MSQSTYDIVIIGAGLAGLAGAAGAGAFVAGPATGAADEELIVILRAPGTGRSENWVTPLASFQVHMSRFDS